MNDNKADVILQEVLEARQNIQETIQNLPDVDAGDAERLREAHGLLDHVSAQVENEKQDTFGRTETGP